MKAENLLAVAEVAELADGSRGEVNVIERRFFRSVVMEYELSSGIVDASADPVVTGKLRGGYEGEGTRSLVYFSEFT